MALQSIVDIKTKKVFAYEALVRGLVGESAASILGQVSEKNRYGLRVHVCAASSRQRSRGEPCATSVKNGLYPSGIGRRRRAFYHSVSEPYLRQLKFEPFTQELRSALKQLPWYPPGERLKRAGDYSCRG